MIIGITGNSGTGKTSICKAILENEKNRKIVILDADIIAKELAVPGNKYFKEITKLFGKEILNSEGKINRKKLANIIFTEPKKRESLNKITYKYVVDETKKRIDKIQDDIIIDAPLLIESGLNKICDIVISVLADEEVKINRICKRDNIAKEDVLLRLNAQNKDKFYIKNSNYVIVNNNTNLEKQAKDIIKFLNSNCYNKDVVIIQKGTLRLLQFKKLLKYNSLVHAFTLKPLDFGSNSTYFDFKDKISKNYKLICNFLKIDYNGVVRPFQTHTNNVVKIENQKGILSKELSDIDGLVTNKQNEILSLVFADCTPIFLYDSNKEVIANVHSGWQGTLKKIAKEAIKEMVKEFKCDPKDIICAIGPTIRKCHFEVDEDVKNEFVKSFKNICKEAEYIHKRKGKDGIYKYNIDTVKLNKLMLINSGVLKNHIIDSNICTVCNKDLMHSYRVKKEKAGRSTSIICKI